MSLKYAFARVVIAHVARFAEAAGCAHRNACDRLVSVLASARACAATFIIFFVYATLLGWHTLRSTVDHLARSASDAEHTGACDRLLLVYKTLLSLHTGTILTYAHVSVVAPTTRQAHLNAHIGLAFTCLRTRRVTFVKVFIWWALVGGVAIAILQKNV